MSVQNNQVSRDYFETMGIPILKGRAIEARDDSTAQKVVVINQQFADHFWPGQDPIGRVVHTGGADHTVIGVVPTGKYQRLGEDPTAFMYFSQAQEFDAGRFIQVRTTGDPAAFIPTLRAEVAAIDADMPLSDVRTMDAHLGIALLPARLTGAVLGIFGVARARPRRDRYLRRDGVRRRAAHARDRDPHGDRRRPRRRRPAAHAPGTRAGAGGDGNRTSLAVRRGEAREQPALRQRRVRRAHVRGGSRAC